MDLSFGEDPAICYAHMMRHHQDFEWRSLVEARILCGQTSAEIAFQLGTIPVAIHAYEALFYNVRDRLDRKDYIVKVILGSFSDRAANSQGSITEHQQDMTWKLCAYYGGPLVLELIVSGLLERPVPAGLDQVEPWLDSTFECFMRRNAMVAARNMEVNRYNVMRIPQHSESLSWSNPALDRVSQRWLKCISRRVWRAS